MKAILLVALCCVFAIEAARWNKEDMLFQHFVKQYNKTYSSAEYELRFNNFKANLKRNAQLNRDHPKATFGINQFSDMSPEEFKQKVLMPSFAPNDKCIWPYHKVARVAAQDIPKSFDWRTKGAVSPVKNQASCGSCWTFSTAENIEGQWQINKGGNVLSLSEQWIVDCSHACLQSESQLCNSGCGGGLPWLAYEDIIKNGGLTDESDYPYTGYQGSCQSGKPSLAKISNWTALSTDPTEIMTYLYNHGRLLFSYTSGIITGSPSSCPNSGSDHAVLLVGYDIDQDYWIVKNSWGTSWGEDGYFRIQYDNGLCGINACVTSALV